MRELAEWREQVAVGTREGVSGVSKQLLVYEGVGWVERVGSCWDE